MNRVVLVGNLGRDPEMRYTQSGTAIANLNVATNERVKKGDSWENQTEWHRVVVFGRRAETCGEYLSKGSKIALEGKLRTRKWEDKEGQTRYATEIVAFNVEFLTYEGQGNAGSKPAHAPAGDEEYEDDVPF